MVQQKAGVQGPWLYDRRVRWLLELTIDEDEHVRFGIEGMDGQCILALDERLLVIKPGFVRGAVFGAEAASIRDGDGTAFGGKVASIRYGDITTIETNPVSSNSVAGEVLPAWGGRRRRRDYDSPPPPSSSSRSSVG